MNPELPRNPREEMELRLTALLLGELSAAEAAAVRAAIAKDPELARLHDDLKSTILLVRAATVPSGEAVSTQTPPLKLSEERRKILRTHFAIPPLKESDWKRRPLFQFRLVELVAVVAILAIFAAMMLPNFVRSRTTSQSNAVINNLRQLDGAKQQWALEHGKSENDVPTYEELKPYFKGYGTPPTVMGESYVLGRVGESPTASVGVGGERKMFSMDFEPTMQFAKKEQKEPDRSKSKAQDGLAFRTWGFERAGERLASQRLAEENPPPASTPPPAAPIVLPPPTDSSLAVYDVATVVPMTEQTVAFAVPVTVPVQVETAESPLALALPAFSPPPSSPVQLSAKARSDYSEPPAVNTTNSQSVDAVDFFKFVDADPARGVATGISGGVGGAGGGQGGGGKPDLGAAIGGGVPAFSVDPEYVGVLERPDRPHSTTNRFIAHNAYVASPTPGVPTQDFFYSLDTSRDALVDPATGLPAPPHELPIQRGVALNDEAEKLPVLGDVPLVGRLYRSEAEASAKQANDVSKYVPQAQPLDGIRPGGGTVATAAGTFFTGVQKGTTDLLAEKMNSPSKPTGRSLALPGPMNLGEEVARANVNGLGYLTTDAIAVNGGAPPLTFAPQTLPELEQQKELTKDKWFDGNKGLPSSSSNYDKYTRYRQLSQLGAEDTTTPNSGNLSDGRESERLARPPSSTTIVLPSEQTGLAYVHSSQLRPLSGRSAGEPSKAPALVLESKELLKGGEVPEANTNFNDAITADPKNRAYFEKKRELDELVNFGRVLNMKLASEKIDVALPKSTVVEIMDKAVPAQKKTGGFLGLFAGDFASSARIKVERDASDVQGLNERREFASYDPYFIQTEFEAIQSEAVLADVVDQLNLGETWGKQRGEGGKLKREEAVKLLKEKLDLRPVRNTSFIEIRAKSDDANEAARIANAVADAYRAHRLQARMRLTEGSFQALQARYQEQQEKIRSVQQELEGLREQSKISEVDATGNTPSKEIDAAPIRKPSTNAPIPQPEIQTSENNFSTFSLNVSEVSFKLAATSLEKGQMPDPASVRSEEFINAFDYRDPEPVAGVPIAFAWERARYPFAQSRDLLRFSLKTAAAGRQAGRPLNIVLLLDNSGSMERADRVSIIHEALRVLASQLQPQDKLSVITFARTARLVADGIAGDKAGEVAEQVSGLTPQGGTNLEDAMNLAYQTAAKHYLANGINRVVLLTDGAANLGNVEPDSLKQKVETQRKQGIALDCFGIGWEGFNDDLLEVLSRNGDGRYGFINSPEEAATDFAGQLAGALQVAASDVKVQVEFNPKRARAYRQIGYAKHQLTKEQFRDNTVDAAEIAAQEAGNALYTVEVNPAGEGPLGTVRVRYKIPGTTDYREHVWDVPFTGNAVSLEQSSPAMRLAASASAFSEWLVASPFAGEVTPDRLLGYLSGVPEVYGADTRPKKLEWMIRQAKSVVGK